MTSMHTSFPLQFIVYSGYYYFLTLLFIGAGSYKLSRTGCLTSMRVCCRGQTLAPSPRDQPHPTEGDPSEQRPLIWNDSSSVNSQERNL